MILKDNIDIINGLIFSAISRSANTERVKLVAVTKSVPASVVDEAVSLGVRCIGENRVQDAAEKFKLLQRPVEKHMIGSLQTNKVKKAVEIFDCIQSVDSVKLAQEIDKRSRDIEKVMPVLVEVNLGEDQKGGVVFDDVTGFLKELEAYSSIDVQGLMAIAPLVDAEETRPYFKRMKRLADSSGLQYLSMGMSGDFEIAIEEGANMVRIGTALFKTDF